MSGHPELPARPEFGPAAAAPCCVVGFPHMVIPLFVGRPGSHQGAGGRDGSRAADHAGGAEAAGRDEPSPTTCSRSAASPHPADAQAARRHREGAGRRQQRAAPTISDDGEPLRRRRHAGRCRSDGQRRRGRGAAPRRDAAVRPVRQAQQEDPAGDPDLHRRHRRRRALADTIAAHLPLKLENKQTVLEILDVRKRLEKLLEQIEPRSTSCRSRSASAGRVKRQMEKSQREYYLNEQVKAIQKELGDGEEGRRPRGDSRRRSSPPRCPRRRARRPTAS